MKNSTSTSTTLSDISGQDLSEIKMRPDISASRRWSLIMLICIILIACTATPALAGTKYLTGSPNLTVSIVGNNEFTPGSTVPFDVQVQNTGLNQIKFVQSGIVDTDDTPNTAKMVTVSLHPGDTPILIKSDPQMIGDIKGSQSSQASFRIYVPDDAKAGKYMLPLTVDYTYLKNAEQEGTDSITYRYVNKSQEIELPFSIQSGINLEVSEVKSENINAGSSGFITLILKNTGTETGSKAVANISRSGNSPIIPVSNSIYVGTFAPDSQVTAKYKVSVSKDAEPQEYPLNVGVTYENADGETLSTPTQKIGVPVGSKNDFTVTSEAPEINPGEKKFVEVTYHNGGSVPVYSAEVRISAVDPFTSSDDLSYLGDLKPGESKVARFGLTVEAGADTKLYGLDSEVKYRDALDDTHVSDTIKVPIAVVSNQGIAAIVSNPVVIGLLVVLILGGGYYLYENRRKQRIR